MTSEQAPTAGGLVDRLAWRLKNGELLAAATLIEPIRAQIAALEEQVRSARADALEEVSEAARDLVTLLDDYMVVTSLTANDRYKTALSRLRAALNPPESSNAAS